MIRTDLILMAMVTGNFAGILYGPFMKQLMQQEVPLWIFQIEVAVVAISTIVMQLLWVKFHDVLIRWVKTMALCTFVLDAGLSIYGILFWNAIPYTVTYIGITITIAALLNGAMPTYISEAYPDKADRAEFDRLCKAYTAAGAICGSLISMSIPYTVELALSIRIASCIIYTYYNIRIADTYGPK